MIRYWIFIILYLVGAVVLTAMLPQYELLLRDDFGFLFHLNLIALAAVLTGMFRGEAAGMAAGVTAALLIALSTRPGGVGARRVCCGAAGFLAGLLARHFRLTGYVFRSFCMLFLLVVERLLFAGVRWFLWRSAEFEIPWLSLTLTALIGSAIYALLAPRLKRSLFAPDLQD